jgi:exonuclease VII small subunit
MIIETDAKTAELIANLLYSNAQSYMDSALAVYQRGLLSASEYEEELAEAYRRMNLSREIRSSITE